VCQNAKPFYLYIRKLSFSSTTEIWLKSNSFYYYFYLSSYRQRHYISNKLFLSLWLNYFSNWYIERSITVCLFTILYWNDAWPQFCQVNVGWTFFIGQSFSLHWAKHWSTCWLIAFRRCWAFIYPSFRITCHLPGNHATYG
jgi:hypothetical protein